MKIAYIVFDGITLLDFIGVYDPVSRLKSIQFLPDLQWDICAVKAEVRDHFNFAIRADKISNDLSGYDVIIIPGGSGTKTLIKDKSFLKWLSSAEKVPLKCSVCTGSLLLGAAGFLQNKRVTTHFSEYDTLQQYGCTILKDQIVEDDGIISAGAISASVQLGLYLAKKWCGEEAAQSIRKWLDVCE